MNTGVIALSLTLAFAAAPLVARAGSTADFDDDAKPILRMQPGLIQYVESHFEVKDTGRAKYPGDDDHRPGPPYIFRARERGSNGPFNLLLLIQPGPPGHILGVVDSTKLHNPPPGPGEQPPEVTQQPEGNQPAPSPYQSPTLNQGELKPIPSENNNTPAQNPAPSQQPQEQQPSPNEPTAETPSGPILPSGNSNSGSTNQPQQNLAPPPDPAPSNP